MANPGVADGSSQAQRSGVSGRCSSWRAAPRRAHCTSKQRQLRRSEEMAFCTHCLTPGILERIRVSAWIVTYLRAQRAQHVSSSRRGPGHARHAMRRMPRRSFTVDVLTLCLRTGKVTHKLRILGFYFTGSKSPFSMIHRIDRWYGASWRSGRRLT